MSSQTITSAMRNVSRARREISRAFPMGVAIIYKPGLSSLFWGTGLLALMLRLVLSELLSLEGCE